MLTLTRRKNESIILKQKIDGKTVETRILVVKIDGAKIRIGIEAPDSVSIRRGELKDEGNHA